jgi:hypothetical protein
MSDLYSAVVAAFERMGWAFRPVEGREVIESNFEAHHAKVSLHVQVFPEIHVVSVVSEAPLERGERRLLAAMGELLMRANTRLTLGAFELDWDAPRVLFRISNVFAPGAYDEHIIASLVHTAIAETDRITPCVAIVQRSPEEELSGLDLADLLEREDLLPAVEED